ncbi:membrane protein [Halomicrobium zhouii]|uniref:Membrane protein n=1 Tax=Halomicrobium zhouii TaxID=767519 RepID=A0A1I6M537_9EURY|nr:YihY/virulence factor BrkB family protein [Halomicrobium zhouii]SFS10800.1 membrane protein [Halomicrobium zhouii]
MSLSLGGSSGRATSVLRAIAAEFKEENITFMAGSIAYYAFVSMFPLLLLALLVASIVGGQAFADVVIGLTQQYLTPAAQGIVTDSITQASNAASFSIIGIVALLWSVLKVFRGLDVAFASLYHSPGDNGILDQVKDGVIVLGGIVVAVAAMVVAGFLVRFVPDVPYIGALSFVFLIAALTAAFFPIYYVFPDVDVSVRDVIPGTVVAAVGWAILQSLFRVYTTYSSTGELYGAIGGVILLVTWLYFGALVLLLGVAVNVVLAGQSEAAKPTPNPEGNRSPE